MPDTRHDLHREAGGEPESRSRGRVSRRLAVEKGQSSWYAGGQNCSPWSGSGTGHCRARWVVGACSPKDGYYPAPSCVARVTRLIDMRDQTCCPGCVLLV